MMNKKTYIIFALCLLGVVLTGYAKKYKTIKVQGTIYYPILQANIEAGDYFDQPNNLIFTLPSDAILAADEQGGLFSFRKKSINPNSIGDPNVPSDSGVEIIPLPVNGGDRQEVMEFFQARDIKIMNTELMIRLNVTQYLTSFSNGGPESFLQNYLKQQDALQLGLQQQYQFLFEQQGTIELKQQVIEDYSTMQQVLQKDLYQTLNDLEGVSRKDRRGLKREYNKIKGEN